MEPRSSSTPSNIGRFRIDALLGSGGMGEVYKAFDPTLKRTVAVKTVRPDIDRPDFLERLYREAQACARLQHRNIVTVYEAGEIGGVVYVAMEYLKGEDLAAVLRRHELTFEGKIQILIQILDALEHAHNEDVIHRDIKPSNAYRQLDGTIKLVDFGLARVMVAETLTLSGAIMGTPHYASPEQLKGEQVDKRTDIYSVGVLAYEMFAGRRPFQSDFDSVATIVLKVISEPTPPIDVSWSRAFPDIERIVGRAMSKAAGDRYQSAPEMRADLVAFLAASKEAIATEEKISSGIAHRTVQEARTLLASGRREDAQTVLNQCLRDNPDAREARDLLASTTLPTSGAVTVPIHRDEPAPVADDAPRAATAPVTSSTAGPRETRYLPPTEGRERSGATSTGRWVLIGGAFAAVAALTAVAVMVSNQSGTGSSLPIPSESGVSARPSAPAAEAPPPATASATVAPTGTAGVPSPPTPAGQPKASSAVPGATVPAAGGSTLAPPTAAPVSAPPEAPQRSPQQLYYLAQSSAGAAANAGLRYRIIQQSPDGGETDVDTSKTFKNGDRVRFAFESNIDGYLYVIQQGSSGRWTVLFPNPDINGGRNQIRKFEQYQVPEGAWFGFDATPGTENVFVFLSREAVGTLPGFDRPVTKLESVQASVVDTLQRSIRSRDLVLEKERPSPGAKPSQSTFVVNREELGKAVSASIQLVHGQ